MKQEKNMVSVLFMLFSILFCVCLIAANVLETKQISVFNISLTGGLIVFPVSYIINDCVCEVWGYQKARLLIWTGFLMNFFFVTMGAICDAIPGAPYWTNEAGFHAIFGLAPRIAAASFVAFLAGSFVNAYVMSRMKLRDPFRSTCHLEHRLWREHRLHYLLPFGIRRRSALARIAQTHAVASGAENSLRNHCVAAYHSCCEIS